MEIGAILGLLQAVPSIFAAAASIRSSLSETDQVKLDAALDEAKASALAHIDQAEADLFTASKEG